MLFRLTGVLFSLNYKKVLTAGHLHNSYILRPRLSQFMLLQLKCISHFAFKVVMFGVNVTSRNIICYISSKNVYNLRQNVAKI